MHDDEGLLLRHREVGKQGIYVPSSYCHAISTMHSNPAQAHSAKPTARTSGTQGHLLPAAFVVVKGLIENGKRYLHEHSASLPKTSCSSTKRE